MKFSIVSYLDKKPASLIRQLQKTVSKITNSNASLSSWEPHVTVGDGVSVSEVQHVQLESELNKLTRNINPLGLKLTSFGFSDARVGGDDEETTPYVLWIEVPLERSLLSLESSIRSITKNYPIWYRMPAPYAPHITLAFRDLSKKGFEDGKKYLQTQDISLEAKIDHIALVEKLENTDLEHTRFSFINSN